MEAADFGGLEVRGGERSHQSPHVHNLHNMRVVRLRTDIMLIISDTARVVQAPSNHADHAVLPAVGDSSCCGCFQRTVSQCTPTKMMC